MARRRRRPARSGKSSPVRIDWSADDLTITGPADAETDLRDGLERKLRALLEAACPWFARSGLAARTAFKIAYGARFGVLPKTHVVIDNLRVTYTNRGRTKKWIHVHEGPTDRRRKIVSRPISTFAKLTEIQGLTKGEADRAMRAHTAKMRAKAERAKKRKGS
jgi:hypothetical protein